MQPDTKRQEVLRLIRSYQRGEVIEADAPKTNPFILGRKAAEAGIAPTVAWCERMLTGWQCQMSMMLELSEEDRLSQVAAARGAADGAKGTTVPNLVLATPQATYAYWAAWKQACSK